MVFDTKDPVICSLHFDSDKDYTTTAYGVRRLKKGANPSRFPTSDQLTFRDIHFAEKAGFVFKEPKSEGDSDDAAEEEQQEGDFKKKEEYFENFECDLAFINSLDETLQNRWSAAKTLSGFETDADFLNYLLDQEEQSRQTDRDGDDECVINVDHPYYKVKVKIEECESASDKAPSLTVVMDDEQEVLKQDHAMQDNNSQEQLDNEEAHDPSCDSDYSGSESAKPSHGHRTKLHPEIEDLYNKIESVKRVEKVVTTSRGRTVKKKVMFGDVAEWPSDQSDDEEENEKVDSDFDPEDLNEDEFDAAEIEDIENDSEIHTTKTDARPRIRVQLCPMCPFNVAADTELDVSHIENHIPDISKDENICALCSKTVGNVDWNAHFVNHVTIALKCGICDQVFPGGIWFGRHECGSRTELSIQRLMSGHSGIPTDIIMLYRQEKHLFYKCVLCESSFNMSLKMFSHLVECHREMVKKDFSCASCGKLFFWRGGLATHEFMVHNIGTKECTHCGKVVAGKLYARHMKLHKAKHTCEICGKQLCNSDKLKSHVLSHKGIKAYACEHCPKTFVQKINRDQHQRLHTGEKRYQCKFCLKKFIQSANYIQHLRVHTKVMAREQARVEAENSGLM